MSNQPRPETDDQTPGDQMNAVPHITDPAAQRLADANLYYTDADGLDALTEIAEVADEEARLFSAEALRLREAMDTLDKLIGSQVGTRKSRAERVLFQPGGDLDVPSARRYLQLTIGGMTAREALSQMVADHAASRVQHGRDVSKRLRVRGDKAAAGAPMSDGSGVERSLEMRRVEPNVPPPGMQPALPPSAGTSQSLPRRVPGAAMQAPGPTAMETTGQIAAIAEAGAATGALSVKTVQSLRDGGFMRPQPDAATAPASGPSPDPNYSASAVRVGDTQRMPRVEPDGEARISDTATMPAVEADSADAEEVEPPVPFSGAANTAAPKAKARGRAVAGKGGDDADG